MGNTPSAQEGRNTRLVKNSRSQESSPELSQPFGPTLSPVATNHQRVVSANQHESIASLLQQQQLGPASQSTLRQVYSHDVAESINSLQRSASNDSFAHFVTPQASRSQLVSPSHNMPGFDPKQIDLKAAVAILEELRKTASPEDLVALHRALLPLRTTTSSDDALPPTTFTRHDSFAAPISPSQEVPGLPKIERKPVGRSTSWKPEMLVSSPLSKLEKLGKENLEHKDAPIPPRASTPGDMDHSHLGSMQLGTLVVMNGTPSSPGPSIAEKFQAPSISAQPLRGDEEYFTAEEAEGEALMEAFGQELMAASIPANRHSIEPLKIDVPPVQSPSAVTVDSNRTLRPDRSGSPLKNQVSCEFSVKSGSSGQSGSSPNTDTSIIDTKELNEKSKKPSKKRSTSRKRLSKAAPVRTSTTRLRDLVGDEFDEPELEEVQPIKSYHSRTGSNVSAAELASEYQAGLPASPFSDSTPVRPPIIVTDVVSNLGQSNDASHVFPDGDERPSPLELSVSELSPQTSQRSTDASDGVNPYAPWSSRAVTRQTALRSHPVEKSNRSSLSSHVDEPSPRPTALTRPSQQSDSGYSTSSRRDSKKLHVETFAQTRLQLDDTGSDEASTREHSPFEPILHHSMLGDEEQAPRGTVARMESLGSLRRRSSSVDSVVHHPLERTEVKTPEHKKSWRSSRLRLSRLLTSENASSQDKIEKTVSAPGEDKMAIARGPKESRTPRKLKKKRPASEVPALAVDLSIPEIPVGMANQFGDRAANFDAREGPDEVFDQNNKMLQMHPAVGQDFTMQMKFIRPAPVKSVTAPVGEPIQPTRTAPLPPGIATANTRMVQQRRSPLTRFLRPKSTIAQQSGVLNPDDDLDAFLYPPGFASLESVSHSLGASHYDFASKDLKQRDGEVKQASMQENSIDSQSIPFPRAQRPKVPDRRRPKSYHGRPVGTKMERVGEETIEDIAYDDMISARHNQRPSTELPPQFINEQQHNRPPRPQSFEISAPQQYIPYRDPNVSQLQPPQVIQQKPSWSGLQDTWRQHREVASRNVQHRPDQSGSNLGTIVNGSPENAMDLPSISAKPRARPNTHQRHNPQTQQLHHLQSSENPLRRPRPLSTLSSAKSQPELRAQARFYADGKVEIGQAHQVSQMSAGSPSVAMISNKQPRRYAQEV